MPRESLRLITIRFIITEKQNTLYKEVKYLFSRFIMCLYLNLLEVQNNFPFQSNANLSILQSSVIKRSKFYDLQFH